MANIQDRRDKNEKLISYSVRVHRGRDPDGKQLKPWTATFEVSPTWTEKSARKKAEAFAATFEKECKQGLTSDTRLQFSAYCDYVIDLKEKRGVKHSTISRYKDLARRIYPTIGHLKLKDIRVDHLNDFYTTLAERGVKHTVSKAKAKIDLAAVLKEKKISRTKIAADTGLATTSVGLAVRGDIVSTETARAVCDVLGLKLEKAFLTVEENAVLSAKTVLEHHRLIHTVLEQALKEGLIPFNPASRADLPKAEKKEVNYFQPEQVSAIRDALEKESIRWKTLVHLFLITGARRGEILGLKWEAVDWKNSRIHIINSILQSVERGVYEDTPKTETSIRWITLPLETMQLLRQYSRAWQDGERLRLGDYYHNQGFVFARDTGEPMRPDVVTNWLRKFSKRHGLPHVNAHAFRHTMASMLYFNGVDGVDSVSISKRLGHAQVSTTANIYAHVMEEADQRNADILADVFLKKA